MNSKFIHIEINDVKNIMCNYFVFFCENHIKFVIDINANSRANYLSAQISKIPINISNETRGFTNIHMETKCYLFPR